MCAPRNGSLWWKWVVVGVWCVCIPIGNYGGTLARTDYKRFAGWRSPPGLTAVRFPPTEFKLFFKNRAVKKAEHPRLN